MIGSDRLKEQLTRQQLYDLVWVEPITTIVTRYGISNVAFAKACRNHNIPVPPRGYWAKIQDYHDTFYKSSQSLNKQIQAYLDIRDEILVLMEKADVLAERIRAQK